MIATAPHQPPARSGRERTPAPETSTVLDPTAAKAHGQREAADAAVTLLRTMLGNRFGDLVILVDAASFRFAPALRERARTA